MKKVLLWIELYDTHYVLLKIVGVITLESVLSGIDHARHFGSNAGKETGFS